MTKVFDQATGARWGAYHCDTVEFTAGMPDDLIDMSVYSPPFSSLYIYSDFCARHGQRGRGRGIFGNLSPPHS